MLTKKNILPKYGLNKVKVTADYNVTYLKNVRGTHPTSKNDVKNIGNKFILTRNNNLASFTLSLYRHWLTSACAKKSIVCY